MSERIMVAMSGGVDSSVAAWLLIERGLDVIGGTLKLYGEDAASADAGAVADRLGIVHHTFDLGADFCRSVIEPFIAVYESGGTPNPCVFCNRHIKFGGLLDRAREMGCSHIATGHYARIEQNPDNGRWLLKRADFSAKDQTYVLYSLTQDQLAHTLFPLGELDKAEVRAIAAAQGFINADKPDSQDICFVPDGDYARFIREYTGREPIPGDFIDAAGRVVGRHKGIIHYTLGQRKGLGLSMGRPIFVSRIDPAANTVTVDDEPSLYSRELIASGCNWIAFDEPTAPIRVTAKARYRHREAPATVEVIGAGRIRVVFDEPQRALTRGQAVVLYNGELVVGGGIIDSVGQ